MFAFMSYRAEIEQMLRTMPSDWKQQWANARVQLRALEYDAPARPDVDDALSVLYLTAGGNESGDPIKGPIPVPAAVREEAMRGLRMAYQHNYGAWNFIGIARAIQLAVVPSIGRKSVDRMRNFFSRHEKDANARGFGDDRKPSRGYLAHLVWGGDPAKTWVNWNTDVRRNPHFLGHGMTIMHAHSHYRRRNPEVEVRQVGTKFVIFVDGSDSGKWASSKAKAEQIAARFQPISVKKAAPKPLPRPSKPISSEPAPQPQRAHVEAIPRARVWEVTPESLKLGTQSYDDRRNFHLHNLDRFYAGQDFTAGTLDYYASSGSEHNVQTLQIHDRPISMSFRNAYLRNVIFSNMTFRNCDFTGCTLVRVTFAGCRLENCKFDNCVGTGSLLFNRSSVQECSFRNSRIGSLTFEKCKLSGVQISSSGIMLTVMATQLDRVDFSGSKYTTAYLFKGSTDVRSQLRKITKELITDQITEMAPVVTPTSAAFRKWFGASKIVNADGTPRVLYHGTEEKAFTAFDRTKIDKHHPGFFLADQPGVAGTYASRPQLDPFVVGEKGGVYRVFVKMEKPYVYDAKGADWNYLEWTVPSRSKGKKASPKLINTSQLGHAAKKMGHDGVIILNVRDLGDQRETAEMLDPSENWKKPQTVYIVFEPRNIKSAAYNEGTWDSSDPDIRRNGKQR